MGAPFTTFFKGGSKIGSKCSVLAARTLEAEGVASETLPCDMLLDGGDNAGATFEGNRPLKIWEDKKRPKFSTFYNNFEFDCKHLWNEWRYRQAVKSIIKYY